MPNLKPARRDAEGSDAAPERKPPPGLHVAACPIGNLEDVSLRLLDLLRGADVIACEDTRNARKLLSAHGVRAAGRLAALHGQNENAVAPALAARAAAGDVVALLSDAGTPGISDPGAALVAHAHAQGAPVRAMPGPCAAIAALSIAGLPADQFFFAGFPPRKAGARARWLAARAAIPGTLILYESPRRIAATVDAATKAFADRDGAIVRELTKAFEDVRRGDLRTLAEGCVTDPPRGEIVFLIGPPTKTDPGFDESAIDVALRAAFASGAGLRHAADTVSAAIGAPRRRIYQRALALQSGKT